MATPVNTFTTHSAKSLKEDLEDVAYRIEPTETPMFTALGKPGKAKGTTHSWMVDQLAAANANNAAIEGSDADADAGSDGRKLSNVCQLYRKTASVSDTAEAVESVGGMATMGYQVAKKLKEIKLDAEAAILSQNVAVVGDAATAPKMAGFSAFLQTNVSRGAGGANAGMSAVNQGYPNVAEVQGTQRAFSETLVKNVMQSCFTEGATPSLIFMGAFNKTKFSEFTGNATKNKDMEDKTVIGAVDIYVSDFGTLTAVPSRHIPARDVLIIDPKMAGFAFLIPFRQKQLATAGSSEKRMVQGQGCLVVKNEKAHAKIADLTTS